MGLITDSVLPFFAMLTLVLSGIIYVVIYELKYANQSKLVSLAWIGASILFPIIAPLIHLFTHFVYSNPDSGREQHTA